MRIAQERLAVEQHALQDLMLEQLPENHSQRQERTASIDRLDVHELRDLDDGETIRTHLLPNVSLHHVRNAHERMQPDAAIDVADGGDLGLPHADATAKLQGAEHLADLFEQFVPRASRPLHSSPRSRRPDSMSARVLSGSNSAGSRKRLRASSGEHPVTIAAATVATSITSPFGPTT